MTTLCSIMLPSPISTFSSMTTFCPILTVLGKTAFLYFLQKPTLFSIYLMISTSNFFGSGEIIQIKPSMGSLTNKNKFFLGSGRTPLIKTHTLFDSLNSGSEIQSNLALESLGQTKFKFTASSCI